MGYRQGRQRQRYCMGKPWCDGEAVLRELWKSGEQCGGVGRRGSVEEGL